MNPNETKPPVDPQLEKMKAAYEFEFWKFRNAHPVYWSDKLGIGGSFTNLEVGLTWMVSVGKSGLARGCVSCQTQTFRALRECLKKEPNPAWTIARIVVGNGFEHHAVVAYKKGAKFETGIIFDPWIEQAPLTYSMEEWKGRMWKLRIIDSIRLEEEEAA